MAPERSENEANYFPATEDTRSLTLRWRKEQVAEALDSSGMTLEQIVAKHLATRLDATKTVHIKYRGRVTAAFKRLDWGVRFKVLKLALQLHGTLPEQ